MPINVLYTCVYIDLIMFLCIYVVLIEPYFLNGQWHVICRIAKIKVVVVVNGNILALSTVALNVTFNQ